MSVVQPVNRHALKEWAVVCRALSEGRQTILLRSGGIADGKEGFPLKHDEFWLLATRFHQTAEELSEEAAPLLASVAASCPPDGVIRLPLYATLEQSFHLHDERQLNLIAGLHVFAPQTVRNRFDYRQPGLSVLLVRAFLPPQPIDLPDSPHFAGCHSWVDLPSPLPTKDLQPVLTDEQFAAQAETVGRLLTDPA